MIYRGFGLSNITTYTTNVDSAKLFIQRYCIQVL